MADRAARIPIALSIAGSDPSGGAGIQADLKTFSALGAYGAAVIAALTAQNTRRVAGVHDVPPEFVALQIDTVFDDLRVDAVKIGMVSAAPIARAIAESLRRHSAQNVVLDPVMVAKSGDLLLDPGAVTVLREELVPLATVITPNLPEAGVLLGGAAPESRREMREAAVALHALGPRFVFLKGGHLEADPESPDILYDGRELTELTAARVPTRNTHGTGCTLSSAIAALLPQHESAVEAMRLAKEYLSGAIEASDRLDVGGGHGPVHHFHRLWPRGEENSQRA